MNKKDYNNAMNKIKATDELKDKILREITTGKKPIRKIKSNKWIALAAMLVIVVAATYLPSLRKTGENNEVKPPINNNGDNNLAKNKTEFKIIGKTDSNIEADYALVVYLDGFSYEYSGWISYSQNGFQIKDIDKLKGGKIGKTNLDLKGLKYEGIPPDFSSTYKVGTEIYEVKGSKKSHAILLVDGNMNVILYNGGKAIADLREPFDLSVKEVIDMITDFPPIKEVELRSEENGSWMRTSYDTDLLVLLNSELPKAKIYNYEEDGRPRYESNLRIPINLKFQDGAVLHAQIYPEINSAYIFGGFINISEDLSNKFKELNILGDEYPRFTNLLGYDRNNIGYFQIQNFITGENIISSEPSWSGSAFYGIYDYYTVDKLATLEGSLVGTIKLGKSELDFIELEIYEGKDKYLFFKINGEAYKIVKPGLSFEDILDFQRNYTN